MSNISVIAIDLAKNFFQLHGTDKKGRAVLKKKVSRSKLLEEIGKVTRCQIYMEACGSSNYWGRKFKEYGHEVKLIHPKYVKPYVKRNKNDRNDAEGIAAAARDPDMRFCEVKTREQQEVQSLHRIRQELVQNRTALGNQIRGLLAEYGIVMAKGLGHIRKELMGIIDGDRDHLSDQMKESVREMYERLKDMDQRIDRYNQKLEQRVKMDETAQRLEGIPGVGTLAATILASVLGNGAGFKNGRHFAAFLGLTPRQHSSGGKERLLGISKGGDTYIRTLLIHGGRAVGLWSPKKTDKLSLWVQRIRKQKGANLAAVATANKIARIAWALAYHQTDYRASE